jgi:hypothetical protein
MVNPLLEFARRPELTVRLPSNGNWYPEGMIEYTPNGEVEVYPMLPKDELILMNPDALLSGQANIELLKSCVPSVKEPEKLLYPDANVLFLAIQKATYGNELVIDVTCPECQKKAIALNDKEKIEEAERNGEIMLHRQDMEFDINTILQSITYLDSEYIVELDNGLKIYIQPNTISDKMRCGLLMFNNEKIIKSYKDYDFEKSMEDEEAKQVRKEVSQIYLKMNEIGNRIIASCIQKIKLPDDTFVTDQNYIYEFVSSTKSTEITKLNNRIKELNDVGLPPLLTYECGCCHYSWEEKFYGFNQVDFFGIGS